MKENFSYLPRGFTPFDELSGMSPDTKILVALSGGADSRMLFELTARYCRAHGSKFYACHVNHGIRSDEAIRDRDFCIALAKECPECADIFVLNVSVPELAKKFGRSMEHQARIVRYDFFDEIMKKHNIPILALAHNSDDNLETILFNLTRGSGVRGMRGIPRVRSLKNGILVRPMLDISKKEVLEFCRTEKLRFVCDSTNEDTDYSRNLIRLQVIPLLERINPSLRESASRLSLSMTELCEFSDEKAKKYLKDGGSISLSKLKLAPKQLLPYIFAYAADSVDVGLEQVHICALSDLCESGKDGASVSLPKGVRAVIYGDALCFEKDSRQKSEVTPEYSLALANGSIVLPDDMGTVSIDICPERLNFSLSLYLNSKKSVNNKNVYKFAIKANIIFDTINRPDISELCLRNRRKGDRILSSGMHKSVKKLMCDKKLPTAVRDIIPMLCLGDEVLWIPAVGTADGIKCQYIK